MAALELHVAVGGEDKVFPLVETEVRLGRGAENDIVLPDSSVSRQHAVLRFEDDSWFVYDLDSTNGVIVNRVKVLRERVVAGDLLQFGIFDLKVEPIRSEQSTGAGGTESAIPNATIVRRLSDFAFDFDAPPSAPTERLSADLEPVTSEADTASRFLKLLNRLARDIIDADTVDRVLQQVLDISFEGLAVDRGFILLGTGAEEAVCELARIGDELSWRPEGEVQVSKTILRTVLEEQVALLTLDALDDQRLIGGDSIRIHGIRAAMCAPLWSDGKVIGFIQVDSAFQGATFSEQDLDFLITLANYAAVGVERIRERGVRTRLARYHSPSVLDEVMSDAAAAADGALRKQDDVTVLFGDLVGFTAFSETAELEEVAELLRGYCSRSVEAIFGEGGTLDKFIGDCVMAFFGAPMSQVDHAARGVRAAIEIQNAIDDWNASRRSSGLPEVRCRIGLNSGPVVVGDVGSEQRVDYTVLGNTVNVAARLESTVAQPGQIVLGEATRAELVARSESPAPLEFLGDFSLKGLQQKVGAYLVSR